MKIPETLQVGGIEWIIKFHPEDFQNRSNQTMIANVDFRWGIINISENVHNELTDMMFLHEVTHIIDYTMGYLTDDRDPESMPITDKNVELRAQLWLQVIKQLMMEEEV